jgi:PAS domain S-box-containing protein
MKEKRKTKELNSIKKTPTITLTENAANLQNKFLHLNSTNSQVGFFRISRDYELFEIDTTMANILGINISVNETPKISYQIKKTLLGLVKSNETISGLEKKIILKDKKSIFLRFYAKSVNYEDKEIITGFAELISSNKQESLSSEPENKNLVDLFNNINSPAWSFDFDGYLIAFNKSFSEYFHLRFDIFPEIGMPVFKIISQKDIADWKFLFDKALKGKRISSESKIHLGDVYNFIDTTASPFRDNSNKVIGIAFVCHNITERKTTENILLENEEKFRQFAENTTDAFILCTNEEVIYVNPAFQKIFGREIQEVYRHYHIPADWVYPEDRERIIDFFNSKEYKKTGKFNGQYRIVKPDGTVIWIWERSFPVFDDQNKIFRFISLASDITRQKQLEFDLMRTRTQQQAIIDNIPHLAWLKYI